MTIEQAKQQLAGAPDFEEPVVLPPALLSAIDVADIPDGALIQVGSLTTGGLTIAWNGALRQEGGTIIGEADYIWARNDWYSPVGLEQYLDLLRRALEHRAAAKADVKLSRYDDDGAFVQMTFEVHTHEKNLQRAFDRIQTVCAGLEQGAQAAADEVGRNIAEIAARLSGWGSRTPAQLVESLANPVSSDAKGRALEELMCRLFTSIDGFTVTDRVRTGTEEIDISMVNTNPDLQVCPRGAVLLTECKNWSGKCGPNDLVLLKEKIERRSRRASLGILIAWNGFDTMLPNKKSPPRAGDPLIVPLTGKDLTKAVRTGNFGAVLASCWNQAHKRNG